MKKIFIIAGPNGAGKSTFAEQFLPQEASCAEFVNADLIAAGLSPFHPETAALSAGRVMLERIGSLTKANRSFAFETTLSSLNWLPRIASWKANGYQVMLHFLKLPSVELAIQRVKQRVEIGGHSIPEAIIRRRFQRGWENLHKHYLAAVDEWVVYSSSGNPPCVIADSKEPNSGRIMEDPLKYNPPRTKEEKLRDEPDPHLAGGLAALKRASKVAAARARAAGLEPIYDSQPDRQALELVERLRRQRSDRANPTPPKEPD